MREILGISPHLPAETEVPTGPHPWRSAILDSERYSRFATLRTGQTVLLRFIKKHDREELARWFRDTPAEEARFLKYDVKAPRWLEAWTKGLNYRQVLPLAAVDLEEHRFLAGALLKRGRRTAGHTAEVQLFVPGPYQQLGLDALLLEELISLAGQMDLQLLKAEVAVEDQRAIRTFRDQGFKIRAAMDDYFLDRDGVTHDVVLLLLPLTPAPAGPGKDLLQIPGKDRPARPGVKP
jgi:RimJ/RimL family protein N-acetyltransferase